MSCNSAESLRTRAYGRELTANKTYWLVGAETSTVVFSVHLFFGSFPTLLLSTVHEHYANDQIRKLCGSLVVLRTGEAKDSVSSQTVHLVHFSVKEYLLGVVDVALPNLERLSFSDAASQHKRLAKICLRYVCCDKFKHTPPLTKELLLNILDRFNFFNYAARCWHLHASQTGDSQEIDDFIYTLFDPKDQRWMLWSDIFETDQNSFEDFKQRSMSDYPTPMYYASLLGLLNAMHNLKQKGVDPNASGGRYGSALQAATANGHGEAVKFLLRLGVDINHRGGEFGSAIVTAAARGWVDILQILLHEGAAIESRDERGKNPLYFSALNGHEATVKLLLEQGAEVSAARDNGMTALYAAAHGGHEAIVKLLLERGAEVSAAMDDGWTILHAAAENGHEATVKLLLERSAKVSAKLSDGTTVLHSAAANGHEAIVRLLLEQGAEVSAAKDNGWTVLHAAATGGHETTIKLLLERGAEVLAASDDGWTALQAAAANGLVLQRRD